MNIQNGSSLLLQIADALRALQKQAARRSPPGDVKLGSLEVVLGTPDGGEYVFGFVEALAALGNDLYWDERGNWSDATTAEVRVI